MILTLLAVATSHPAELQLTSRNTCRESSAARAKGAPPPAQRPSPTPKPSSLSCEDIDSVATCGESKCYIQSKKEENVGYLINRHTLSTYIIYNREGRMTNNTAPAGWVYEYANCVAKRYGANHLLMAPEERITAATPIASCLEAVRVAHYNPNAKKKRRPKKTKFKLDRGEQLVLHQVQTAPYPSLLVGCSKTKWKYVESHLPAFASKVNVSTAFVERLEAALERTRTLLLDETCLLADLQFYVSSKGEVYHLDLDRSLRCQGKGKKTGKSASRCLTALGSEFKKYIKQLKG